MAEAIITATDRAIAAHVVQLITPGDVLYLEDSPIGHAVGQLLDHSCPCRPADATIAVLTGICVGLDGTCILKRPAPDSCRTIAALNAQQFNGQTMVSNIRLEVPETDAPRLDRVNYVVTQFGIAKLKGRPPLERAANLIDIAHPDFREGLHRSYITGGITNEL